MTYQTSVKTTYGKRFANTAGIWLCLSVCAMKGLLDAGYIGFVSVFYDYQGFALSIDIFRYVESWVLTFFVVAILPSQILRPSDFFMITLTSWLVIPMASLFGLSEQSRFAIYYIIAATALINWIRMGRPFAISNIKYGTRFFVLLAVLVSALVIAWLAKSGKLGSFNLNLRAVYGFRTDNAEVINVGIFAYLNSWATKVVGPALLVFAYYRRSRVGIISVFILHVFWFGMLQHKAILFYPALTLFLCVWLSRSNASFVFFVLLALVLGGALAISLLLDSLFWAGLLVRRMFFSGAINTFAYFDFFSENVRIYWSNSSLTLGLLEYPYHVRPGELIGEARGTESNANNSFLSMGYMHAGAVGLTLYCVIVGLLFRLIDSIGFGRMPVWLALGPFVVSIRTLLLSTDLLTALLSHGVAFAIILGILMRSLIKRTTLGATAE